jgi:hypothetical protein
MATSVFIDGRTELYGEKFFVDYSAARGLMEPDNLFRLLEQYKIQANADAHPKRGYQTASSRGWQKVFIDYAGDHPRPQTKRDAQFGTRGGTEKLT